MIFTTLFWIWFWIEFVMSIVYVIIIIVQINSYYDFDDVIKLFFEDTPKAAILTSGLLVTGFFLWLIIFLAKRSLKKKK